MLCVERAKSARFLGGAWVFPGGKVDATDGLEAWADVASGYVPPSREGGSAFALSHAVCAMRECFEEARLLHVARASTPDLEALHAAHARAPHGLAGALARVNARLDLSLYLPVARWVTPTSESRRFDTRFFAALAPEGQEPRVDGAEATRLMWASPKEVLADFDAGRVTLFPPTHRMLEVLSLASRWRDVVAYAAHASLAPICPELTSVEGTLALTLPGDPRHSVREARVSGRSRYVLRGARWVPEEAPA